MNGPLRDGVEPRALAFLQRERELRGTGSTLVDRSAIVFEDQPKIRAIERDVSVAGASNAFSEDSCGQSRDRRGRREPPKRTLRGRVNVGQRASRTGPLRDLADRAILLRLHEQE